MNAKRTAYTRRLASIIVMVGTSAGVACADFLDTTWTVTQFDGEAWFVEPEKVIGQTQTFEGGYAEGAFYTCDFNGQSSIYTTYENEAFFENPEFVKFAPLWDDMMAGSQRLFVHRVTCNGNDLVKPSVFYPVVTNETRRRAWYLYEGGVFSMTAPGE